MVDETLQVNVDYTDDDDEESLTLNIPAADEISHEFRVSVTPGVVRFDVEIHGEWFPFDRVARAADLEIVDTGWETVNDGQIAVDVTVRNTGNLGAEGILVFSSAVLTDGRETEGTGQIEWISEGETRTVEVLMNLPAGEYVLDVEVLTTSLEADQDDNSDRVLADVAYVEINYDYMFTPGGYWSDGTANVDVAVTASNSGIGAFTDVAEVSYSCAGADSRDNVSTGKFEFDLPDGFSSTTRRVTLRSSPGTIECRFRSQEQGSETYEHEVAAKIVGVSREVWDCYRDQEINRQDDFGCSGHHYQVVSKWDIDRPLNVWATGDPEYIDVLWSTLYRLSPIFDMTFTRVQSEGDADLKAWVGITRAEGPERLRSGKCVDAAGCAFANRSNDYAATDASIGVWTVESDWLKAIGLVDRRIEHVMLHELMHALMPMGHRDDPLSAVNNINAPDWINLDPSEEELVRLHRNHLIRPGMTMEEVRALIVLENELVDAPAYRDESLTPMVMLREAYRTLQNADSATWRLEGGWSEGCSDFRFGRADYTIAGFYSRAPYVTRLFDGPDRMFRLYGENWSRRADQWLKNPRDFWENTYWRPRYAKLHDLLVSALYHASDRDIRVESVSGGETTLRITLDNTIVRKSDWYRSARLEGRVTIDDRTLEITAYEMDWHFDTVGDYCGRYEVFATQGRYGVRIEVPDTVYYGTTDDLREVIDRVNGRR